MKHYIHAIIITIILTLSWVSPSMAQNAESERLKSALEQAFAPAAKTTATPVSTNEEKTILPESKPTATTSDGRLYYVQLFYSRVQADVEQKKAASRVGKITRYTHNGLYKYCAGGFPSKADADAMVPKARKAGYTSAFVIALKDGKRIDL